MSKTNSTKLTAEQATRKVFELFCRGLTREHIIDLAHAEKWGLTEKVLSSVIDDATDRLIETGKALDLDTEVGKSLRRLETLYQEAATGEVACPKCATRIEQPADIKTALAVQKEINALLGLGERARAAGGVKPLRSKSQPAPARSKVLNFKP